MGRLAGDPEVFDAALHAPLARYFDRLRALVSDCLREARVHGQMPAGLDGDAVAATLVAAVQGGYVLSRTSSDPDAVNRATVGAMALLDSLAGTSPTR